MDEPVEPQQAAEIRPGCGTVLSAAIALVLAALVLMLLPIGYLGIAILVGGLLFVGLIAFHYFAWGKWVLRSSDSLEGDDR